MTASEARTGGLSIRDHMTLQYADLDGSWLDQRGTLRWVFSEPPSVVLARLNRLIDTQAAEAAYPVLVHRLRRLRDQRRAARRAG